MPSLDFTHCKGKQCTLKKICYRYIAYRSYLESKQDFPISFFLEIPFKDGECEYHVRNKEELK